MSGAGGDRIAIVGLDVTGHFTGQVQTIPVASGDSIYALVPSLAAAPRGDGSEWDTRDVRTKANAPR
jgi:hypothetical protein